LILFVVVSIVFIFLLAGGVTAVDAYRGRL
jgi:hypothetical protein